MKYLDHLLEFDTVEQGQENLKEANKVLERAIEHKFGNIWVEVYSQDIKEIERKIEELKSSKRPSKKRKPSPHATRYRKKVRKLKELCQKHNLQYNDILTRYWYGVNGKERKDLKIKLTNFVHGKGYKYAYHKDYKFMEKLEEFVKLHLKNDGKDNT